MVFVDLHCSARYTSVLRVFWKVNHWLFLYEMLLGLLLLSLWEQDINMQNWISYNSGRDWRSCVKIHIFLTPV